MLSKYCIPHVEVVCDDCAYVAKIIEQMNNNNLSTLLKESDFNFVKVIEL